MTAATNAELERRTRDLEHTIDGNGNEGLKIKVERMDGRIMSLERFVRSVDRFKWAVVGTVIAGCVSAVFTLALTIVGFVINHGKEARWLLPIALACLLTGCTYVSYGDATAISAFQKRTLVVETNADGSLKALRYSSGSDPVIVTVPGVGEIGRAN